MLRSRAALYFEEVAKRGSIRQAAETLHIAASAIDRQILILEQHFNVSLFERTPQGLRLTSAGEALIEVVRRWSRDMDRVQSVMDDLQGLRQGNVSIAMVEGVSELFCDFLEKFHESYPGISLNLQVAGSQAISEMVASGVVEVGIPFSSPEAHSLRVERTLSYPLGLIIRSDQPPAMLAEISLAECSQIPLIIPDDSISLRATLDRIWRRKIGEPLKPLVTANSISMIKSIVMRGLGGCLMTELDAFAEIRSGKLKFIPLAEKSVPVWALSIVTSPGRVLSKPASLMIEHLSASVADEGVKFGRGKLG
jgi:DNA-binding transcriptional LysR family regulator